MPILYNEKNCEFHIYNKKISYIFTILKNNQLGHLYFGKYIKPRDSFEHLLSLRTAVLAPTLFSDDMDFSLETIKQEYPAYGKGDFRMPAYQVQLKNGSRITEFEYQSHKIYQGKEKLNGLPSTYSNSKSEVTTLEIVLHDPLINCDLILYYHVFEELPVIARSCKFVNKSEDSLKIQSAMSLSVDFYDSDYEMITLDGAWSRERHIHKRQLTTGIQSIASVRGASSANHNPFIALKRMQTTESEGEAYGFGLIYSGNFIAQAQVDSYDVTRIMLGINPFEFEWTLNPIDEFQTPEAVMIYSDCGLNKMSQAFHELCRNNLMRGKWKDKVRPILINNWEATYFDFDESKILNIAQKAKDLGMELFVLDDGWFGKRDDDTTSLGDWYSDLNKLPNGVSGLSKKIKQLGISFGLWFEPEMVNEISDLYKAHPEWVISTPNRNKSYGRNQFVLDYSNNEVVEFIFNMMAEVISNSEIDYIKWDMNRNITEAFTATLEAENQKEFFHRYILGVYKLYEKLINEFPNILFESCASGGARFDLGMMYYAPQAWSSDDTDAVERIKIQYGTSMVYPLVSMGSHVSAIPNHQVGRETSLKMRANVAYFGTFGYELDLTKLTEQEQEEVTAQVEFFKRYREVIQFGDFYRIKSPFEENGNAVWMIVSKDKKIAIVAYYKVLAIPNTSIKKIKLLGLDEELEYQRTDTGMLFGGDELMNMGLLCETEFSGVIPPSKYKGICTSGNDFGDFTSHVIVFEAN
jgi:alpha-galactosidase